MKRGYPFLHEAIVGKQTPAKANRCFEAASRRLKLPSPRRLELQQEAPTCLCRGSGKVQSSASLPKIPENTSQPCHQVGPASFTWLHLPIIEWKLTLDCSHCGRFSTQPSPSQSYKNPSLHPFPSFLQPPIHLFSQPSLLRQAAHNSLQSCSIRPPRIPTTRMVAMREALPTRSVPWISLLASRPLQRYAQSCFALAFCLPPLAITHPPHPLSTSPSFTWCSVAPLLHIAKQSTSILLPSCLPPTPLSCLKLAKHYLAQHRSLQPSSSCQLHLQYHFRVESVQVRSLESNSSCPALPCPALPNPTSPAYIVPTCVSRPASQTFEQTPSSHARVTRVTQRHNVSTPHRARG